MWASPAQALEFILYELFLKEAANESGRMARKAALDVWS
jgi:hypothetical protein